ncbi:MAG: WD40 repeat domain-containing protein [Planctomycetota bacterium]|jgi:WD40 repeat protein
MHLPKPLLLALTITCSITLGALNSAPAQEPGKSPKPAHQLKGLSKYILGINFSADGKLVAAGDGSGTVCIWDVKTGELSQMIAQKGPQEGRGFRKAVFHVAFHPEGKLFASCGKGATVYQKGKEKYEPVINLAKTQSCRGISFSPDGKLLLVGYNGPGSEVAVYNTETWQKTLSLPGRHYAAEAVPVHPDGSLVASGAGKAVVVWDLKDGGKTLAKLPGHKADVESSAWHPTKKILAAGDRQHTIVIWDVEKKEAIKRIDTHEKAEQKPPMMPVEFLAFDPNGKWLAATTLDGMLKIYGTDTYEEKISLYPQGDEVERKGQVGLAVSPDGQWIAAGGGTMNEIVTLWKVSELLGK